MLAEFWRPTGPTWWCPWSRTSTGRSCRASAAVPHSSPFVTILTDFADYPPHFWIERQDQYFICGTDRGASSRRRRMATP